MITLEERALAFATEAHAGQVRKYTGEPYITHPIAVAEIVRSVPHTPEMIAAALLHDTVEDTSVTFADIRREFGVVVAEYVYYLTDISKPSDGPRKIRKAMDRQHISVAPREVKTIKLGDLNHNTSSIVQHDVEFAQIYLGEKALLLTVLEEGDPVLYARAYGLLVESEAAIVQRALSGVM